MLRDVVYVGVSLAVLAWMGVDAAHGRVSVATMTAAIAVVPELSGAIGFFVGNLTGLLESLRIVQRYQWLEGRRAEVEAAHEGTVAPPAALASSIGCATSQ